MIVTVELFPRNLAISATYQGAVMSAEYVNSLFGLDGQSVVVIGGTGVLGGAMCDGLAKAGAHVIDIGSGPGHQVNPWRGPLGAWRRKHGNRASQLHKPLLKINPHWPGATPLFAAGGLGVDVQIKLK